MHACHRPRLRPGSTSQPTSCSLRPVSRDAVLSDTDSQACSPCAPCLRVYPVSMPSLPWSTALRSHSSWWPSGPLLSGGLNTSHHISPGGGCRGGGGGGPWAPGLVHTICDLSLFGDHLSIVELKCWLGVGAGLTPGTQPPGSGCWAGDPAHAGSCAGPRGAAGGTGPHGGQLAEAGPGISQC